LLVFITLSYFTKHTHTQGNDENKDTLSEFLKTIFEVYLNSAPSSVTKAKHFSVSQGKHCKMFIIFDSV
jgi:hypothetical protein